MHGSAKVRVARKNAQKRRLAAKKRDKSNDYAKFYSNQPQEKLKAELNSQIKAGQADIVAAHEAIQIAEIEGTGLLAAQEAYQVAVLTVRKLETAKFQNVKMTLTRSGDT